MTHDHTYAIAGAESDVGSDTEAELIHPDAKEIGDIICVYVGFLESKRAQDRSTLDMLSQILKENTDSLEVSLTNRLKVATRSVQPI